VGDCVDERPAANSRVLRWCGWALENVGHGNRMLAMRNASRVAGMGRKGPRAAASTTRRSDCRRNTAIDRHDCSAGMQCRTEDPRGGRIGNSRGAACSQEEDCSCPILAAGRCCAGAIARACCCKRAAARVRRQVFALSTGSAVPGPPARSTGPVVAGGRAGAAGSCGCARKRSNGPSTCHFGERSPVK